MVSIGLGKEAGGYSNVFKPCKRCGFPADERWYTQSHTKKGYLLINSENRPHSVCPACLQEERDRRKTQNRALSKARTAIYTHCRKYNHRHNLELSPTDFGKRFGWDIKQMAHDINHAYENGCPYCGHSFKGMGNGLRDLSIDIINPESEPYYATNTKYCCFTCNSEKGQRGADAFGLSLAEYRRREEWLKSKFGTSIKPQFRMDLN